jgi:hypothetical protein
MGVGMGIKFTAMAFGVPIPTVSVIDSLHCIKQENLKRIESLRSGFVGAS